MRLQSLALATLLLPPLTLAQTSFVNWESPHVHPLDLTPNGQTLLAVNTADNRLELFDVSGGGPTWTGSISVGLDPVSVRARSNTEAWVVNHISDSVSVVDLSARAVIATLATHDEPCDVVFAGTLGRAFVSCSQANVVQVFNPADLSLPPISIAIDAEDPRTMAVSPDGTKVYVAIFESGNKSTILGGGIDLPQGTLAFPPNVVSDPAGPYGGVNPPPNAGAGFQPPIAPGNNPPIKVGLIVKQNAQGQWMDDNGGNWTALVSGAQAAKSGRPVGWHLPDRDIAIIDANTLALSYETGLMNLLMAIGVNPATGRVAVVGTDGINEKRFEPEISGRFLRVNIGLVDASLPGGKLVKDLNPHLSYAQSTIPQIERDKSIGDPRGIVFSSDGTLGYVAGMGSNNVIVIDADGDRAGIAQTIEVAEGPTGLAIHTSSNRLFVLSKFAAEISVIDTQTEQIVDSVAFYDPSPVAIKLGRKHLYDTRSTSGLGHTSCASCHIDARMDRLAWDLGDPSGTFKSIAGQNLGAGILGLSPGTTQPPFANWHPMKGPMTTQTLQDIIGNEPHHWRGDRNGIEEFNPAFIGLLGDDAQLTASEMQEFEDFLDTIHFPPNPFRNLDNTLPASLPLPGHFTPGVFGPAGQPLPNGNAQNGMTLYRSLSRRLDAGAFACVTCHTLPTGHGTDYTFSGGKFNLLAAGSMGERHHQLVSVDGSTNRTIKTPQLRNLYDKVGFEATQVSNRAGFGFTHDGAVDSIARFVAEPVFTLLNDQEVADMVAFMLAFSGSDLPTGTLNVMLDPPGTASRDAHAAVGVQVTVTDIAKLKPEEFLFISSLVTLADTNKVGLTAKARRENISRGYAYLGGNQFQSDRASEKISQTDLLLASVAGSPLTYTIVPKGSETRIGIDRDEDGFFDRDEIEVCSDPADPTKIPGSPGTGLFGDLNGDGMVGQADLGQLLASYGLCTGQPGFDPKADLDGDGCVGQSDLGALLGQWGKTCG